MSGSDMFFTDNKDIDDVLMATNENIEGKRIERVWMASQEEDVKIF